MFYVEMDRQQWKLWKLKEKKKTIQKKIKFKVNAHDAHSREY